LARNAGARAHGKAAWVDSPFTEETNLLVSALMEANVGFRLSDSPRISLSAGAEFNWEDSDQPGAADYYAPDSVLSAKGSLGLAARLDSKNGWAADLSLGVRAGVWSNPADSFPIAEAAARAEISKGDLTLFVDAGFSRTGDADTLSYWEARTGVGARLALPDYIIQR
jgi:hypothetical protein